MDDGAPDTILVVSEREFLVNRKTLVENSAYFRAMFEGGFIESSSDRVELNGISDADAFAVLIEYVLNKRVNLKQVEGNVSSVLAVCDMLSLDSFSDILKLELFQNWSDLKTVKSILDFAERLNVRHKLWWNVLSCLKTAFKKECVSSILDTSPDLVVAILGTEEPSTICFWDIEYDECFVKGVISWVQKHQLPQSSIRKVVRCFGTHYQNNEELFQIINMEVEPPVQYILKTELYDLNRNCEKCFKQLVHGLCIGILEHNLIRMIYYQRNGGWNLLLLDCLVVDWSSFKFQFNPQMVNAKDSVNTDLVPHSISYWVPHINIIDYNKPFYFNPPVYTSTEYASFGTYHLLIFELECETTVFSEVFRAEVPGHILGCELIRLEDVLHGFVTYEVQNNLYNVCHFLLYKNNDDQVWFNNVFSLEPLLCDIRQNFTPVSTSTSTDSILLLFHHEEHYLFLTEYNHETGFLKPLEHIRMPGWLVESVFDQTLTVKRNRVRVPLFHVRSVLEKHKDYLVVFSFPPLVPAKRCSCC